MKGASDIPGISEPVQAEGADAGEDGARFFACAASSHKPLQ